MSKELLFSWIFVLCVLVAPGLLQAADPGETAGSGETLHQRLEALDREIQAHLRRLADQAVAGEATDPDLLDDAQGLRRELAALEHAAREQARAELGAGRQEEATAPFQAKLRQLRLLVGNLETSGHEGASVAALPGYGRRLPVWTLPSTHGFAPPNDDCMNALAVGFGTYTGDTSGATNDAPASCGASIFSPDVWFKYTATDYGTVSMDTFGSAYDTVLSVYTGCPATTANEWTCNDDAFGLQSAVSFYGYIGDEYWIRVSGFDGASGAFQLRLGQGGTISGTVTDAATGDPLPDGRVEAQSSQGYYVGSTWTGAAGEYTLGSLQAGGYFVGTDDFEGFVDELYDDVACPGGFDYGCSTSEGTAVQVPSSGDVGGVDFALARGGSIQGTVKRAVGGTPIADVLIEVYDAQGSSMGTDYTAADGTFLVEGLAGGDHFVVARGSGLQSELFDDVACPFGCDPTTGTPVHVQLGGTSGGIDFALDELGSISGMVTSTGAPAPYVDIEVYRKDGSSFDPVGSTYTDSTGSYQVAGLPSGTYALRTNDYDTYINEVYDDVACCSLSAGTPVAVALNAAVTGIDFDLDRLGNISGTVTDAATGDPVSGVDIEIRTPTGGWIDWAYTDASGHYTSGGLSSGTYAVHTELYYYSSYFDELYEELPCPGRSCDPSLGTPVPVLINTTTPGIDFTLDLGGAISGTLIDSAGNPITSYEVDAYDDTGSWVADAYTDSTGVYRFPGLEPGTYYVRTNGYSYEFYDELYDDLPCDPGCDPTDGAPITVVLSQETGGVDFVLERLAAVTGSVFDEETGDPLIGIGVEAWAAEGSSVGYGYTDSSGTYLLEGLPPGTCYVGTTGAHWNGYLDELYSDIPCPAGYGCEPTKGSPVPTAFNATTEHVHFALRTSGSVPRGTGGLRGTVEDTALGGPLLGVLVDVWDDAGSRLATVVTDSAGRYDVSLAAGTYFVSTDNRRGLLDEVYGDVLCPGGPASGGGCDPLLGAPVLVGSAVVTGIDFTLATEEVFADGFESGNVSAWSGAVGVVP